MFISSIVFYSYLLSALGTTNVDSVIGNKYTAATITCKLSDILEDYDISFESDDFLDLSSAITSTNGSVTVTQGAHNSEDMTKEAEVVIEAAAIEVLAAGNYSVSCFVDFLNADETVEVLMPGLSNIKVLIKY